MRATIPTIKKILGDGGSVILMSHLGRPKDGPTEKYSLKHLVNHLIKLLDGATVKFADDCIGEEAATKSANLQPGEVLLLENLRFYKEEEKGDTAFAEKTQLNSATFISTMHLVLHTVPMLQPL